MKGLLRKDVGAGMVGGLLVIVGALVVAGLSGPSGADGPAPAPRVVRVVADPAIGPAVLATGFEAGPGRVVTVAHVLDGKTDLAVRRAHGARRRARVVRVDRQNDVALLAVAGGAARGAPDATPTAPVATRAEAADEGTRLLVHRAGRVRALRADVRRRLIARIDSPAESTSYRRPALELAVEVRVGDSGAPVIDPDGRVVGVLFARSRTRSSKAYAVDGKVIPGLLDDGVAP